MTGRTGLFDLPAFAALQRELRCDPQSIRTLRTRLLKHCLSDSEALADFPAPDRIQLHSLSLFRRCDSAVDGATKLLFQTSGGLLLESVILRLASGRTSLCVSSQVGCAAACDFCATGKMGMARNLTSSEILDQIVQTGQILRPESRTLRNIVFMGMGEPFHNEKHLHDALAALQHPQLFHHSPKNILVSTVGVADAMLRCAERFPGVNLALSLHSVRQDVRERLIPLAIKYPLDLLRHTIERLGRDFRARTLIEYLMLAGVNDSESDADELRQWLGGLDVHVNLIPYNAIEESPHLIGSDRPTIQRFATTLKSSGFKVTIRHSLGNDIAAACGQLVKHENRQLVKVTAKAAM